MTSTDHPSPHTTRDRGFTMVEILIAIVLVGILSAVVVVGVARLTETGNAAACTASADAARAGSMSYFAAHLAQPTTLAQLISPDDYLTLDRRGHAERHRRRQLPGRHRRHRSGLDAHHHSRTERQITRLHLQRRNRSPGTGRHGTVPRSVHRLGRRVLHEHRTHRCPDRVP